MPTIPGEMNYEIKFHDRATVPDDVFSRSIVQSAVVFSLPVGGHDAVVLLIEFKRKLTVDQVERLFPQGYEVHPFIRHACFVGYQYWGQRDIGAKREVFGFLRQRKQLYLSGRSRDRTTIVRRTREIDSCSVCKDQAMLCPMCMAR